MDRGKIIIVGLILFLASSYAYKVKRPTLPPIPDQPIAQVEPEKQPEVKPDPKPVVPPKPVEPVFDDWPLVRTVNDERLGKVLQDIDGHMPAGHQYRFADNKVTWAHETTHGINSNIRNKNKDSTQVNGFYCLQNRACVIYEPKTTIRKVAPRVPQVLRGPSYNLYLVQQTGGWNDRPLYLFDEWVAYTNGTETGRELNHTGWYFELLQAHNFNVYCIYTAMTVQKECPDYDDKQMKAFMMWNIERTFRLAQPTKDWEDKQKDILPTLVKRRDTRRVELAELKRLVPNIVLEEDPDGYGDDQNPTANALEYVNKVRTHADAEDLRTFARKYFGAEWCKRVYGF